MRSATPEIEILMRGWTPEIREIALGLYRRTGALRFKYGREAITEADLRIETLLRGRIGAEFPDDAVVGEELGADEDASNAGRTWYLDPIDGTLNFALGLPDFCTSVALMAGDEVLAAMVYQPLLDECFTATRGRGARLNGEPIHVSGRASLAEAVASMQLQKDGRFVRDGNLLQGLVMRCLKMRRLGTIALEMAYVADGRFDCLIAGRGVPQNLYDVAAGILLVEEAGGRISDHLGRDYLPGSTDLLASNGLCHDDLVGTIRELTDAGDQPSV